MTEHRESNSELLSRLSDRADAWAAEFRKIAIGLGYSDMDEGWLIGWFANAIENSSQVRRWRAAPDWDKITRSVINAYTFAPNDEEEQRDAVRQALQVLWGQS